MILSDIIKIIKISALCIIAAALNFTLTFLSVPVLKIPLFLDTIFTAAVTFSAGLIPGLITAVLTWAAGPFIDNGQLSPFVICSIAEVFIINRLKPSSGIVLNEYKNEKTLAKNISILARLMLLYIAASMVISILGGLVDFIFYSVLPNSKGHISAEDIYKAGLQQSRFPVLVMNILSRIPVNLVDRFIVIFGGYFISLGAGKLLAGNSKN